MARAPENDVQSPSRRDPDFQTRLISPARRIRNGVVTGAEINDVLHRLLLFETYILDSARLLEIPSFVAAFGVDGVVEMLNLGVLQISCEPLAISQIGQTAMVREQHDLLPQCSYAFRFIQIAEYEDFLHRCLQPLHELPGIKHKSILRLKRAIASNLVRVPLGLRDKMQSAGNEELRNSSSLFRSAVNLELKRRFGPGAVKMPITLRLEETAPGDFRFESDIKAKFNLSAEDVHSVGVTAGFAVFRLTQRLSEMEAYSALTGFSPEDITLAQAKFGFVATAVDPHAQECRLQRVLDLAGLPEFNMAWGERIINVDKLIALRNSDDCRALREWLRSTDRLSDEEVQGQISNLRNSIGSFATSVPGKMLRFLVSSGIGIAGPLSGALAGVIDTFIVERLFPKRGIVSFICNDYPSLFEYPPRDSSGWPTGGPG